MPCHSISFLEMQLVLCRHGLSVVGVERIQRFALMHSLFAMTTEEEVEPQDRARADAAILSNICKIKEIDPSIPWACEFAARYWEIKKDPWQAMQVYFSSKAHISIHNNLLSSTAQSSQAFIRD